MHPRYLLGLTLINLKGIHMSALLNNACCTMGTILPLICLIGLGCVWFFSGRPLQIDLSANNLIPLSESQLAGFL